MPHLCHPYDARGKSNSLYMYQASSKRSGQRRLSKDYERLASTAEAVIFLVGIRLLLVHLVKC